jgi:hypothetical protein
MFTRGNSWFLRMEEKIGSIEPGKLADLVVLDRDYFTVPAPDIKKIRSVLTVVDGKIAHNAGARREFMIRSVRIGVFGLLVFGLSLSAAAQDFSTTRFTMGGSFIISQPKEEFSLNVGNGYGANGTVMYHLLRSGLVNLRLDFSGAQYDSEKLTVPLSPTIGGRILVDVTTRNSILALSLGPELAKPTGRIRPYVNVAVSRLFFRTTSSIEGVDDEDGDFADTTNYKDGTGAWVCGGGLRFPLGRESSPVTLDLGLRYHRGGEVSYLKEGSIIDRPDGSIAIFPLSSRTPFLVYTFGVQFRIPHGGSSCSGFLC